jgi:hypothetical protein
MTNRVFTCAICHNIYQAREADDDACRQEFIDRYGHAPEDTTDDELVSICDACNDEFNRLTPPSPPSATQAAATSGTDPETLP